MTIVFSRSIDILIFCDYCFFIIIVLFYFFQELLIFLNFYIFMKSCVDYFIGNYRWTIMSVHFNLIPNNMPFKNGVYIWFNLIPNNMIFQKNCNIIIFYVSTLIHSFIFLLFLLLDVFKFKLLGLCLDSFFAFFTTSYFFWV